MDKTLYRYLYTFASAVMAASITVVIAFVMFMIFGDGIEQTLVWMLALGIMAFGGTFVGVYLGSKNLTPPTDK
ncbi:hypothetical protein BSZ39_11210 [Bowdeniella nasicola]|uniref:Uncharacterized protein n=1 Tax=Bowdeniella nasicola TaxID=208480 RepID=A0A1Q5Q090_9ACTO|nr:hypothetical protein [Bowdeniella nasicola]OKL53125.1 hypothetical protein BSZ39_11210 [Bowdeniella nasicola]